MVNISVIFFITFVCFFFSLSVNSVFSLAPPPVPTLPFSTGLFDSLTDSSSLRDSLDSQLNDDDDNTLIVDRDPSQQLEDIDKILTRESIGLNAATQVQGNEEAIQELNDDIADRALVKSGLLTKKLQEDIEREETKQETAQIQSTLDPPTSTCDTNKFDLAIHEIEGKAKLDKVLKSMHGKNNKDVIFQMILDMDSSATETSLVLLDTLSTNLKGKIIVGVKDSDPKDFDFDIEKVHTNCIENTVAKKTLTLESNIDDPLVITDIGTKLLNGPTTAGTRSSIASAAATTSGGGQIFQECKTSDFAKYSIVVDGKDLVQSGEVNGNNVNIKIRIVVDLDRSPITSKNAATVIDDNRIIALTLISDEGKSDEEIFKFIPVSINTDCKTVSYLVHPVNIADNDEFTNPLYGFKTS
jgi:hypothetical protein